MQAAVAGAASAGIPVSAFSLDDLERLCGGDGVTLERLLERLRVAGLSAVAELPADRMADPVRAIEAAVGAGLPVSRVTIREAHGDERLALIRRVAGWTIPPQAVWAFAPLPRTDGGDARHAPATGYDDVRQVAFARLVVDNIDTIQVDWTLHGPKLAQVALTFGAMTSMPCPRPTLTSWVPAALRSRRSGETSGRRRSFQPSETAASRV